MTRGSETKQNAPWVRWVWLVGLALGIVSGGCRATLGPDGEATGAALNQAGCTAGTIDCSGRCVTLGSSDLHCGACGNACGAGQYCEGGLCTNFCPQGSLDCVGACVVASSDTNNCGACGKVCVAGEYCDAGSCSTSCSGSVCPTAAGDACVHFESNNEHCGACGNACSPGMSCQGGACVKSCAEGRLACGDVCVDVRSDSDNCGTCGNVCPAGTPCVEGACGGDEPVCTGGACACTGSQKDCNGVCIDTQANPLHCGACGNECLPTQTCKAGSCACPSETQLCGEACVNTQSDDANCGACGNVCTGGTSCSVGECVCAEGMNLCDDSCVDFQQDANHCGGCGVTCESYEECVSGICKYDGDQCGGDARNIDVARVALYQGVEVDLFEGGEVLSAEARSADVIQSREALLRVFVTPGAGFVSRELSARVFVENDQEITVYHHKRVVSGASSQNNLGSTFLLNVPADVLRGETKYWIELAECATLPEGTVGTVRVPTTPGENADFGARKTGVIKVVFVPVTHDGRTPDVSDATISAYVRDVEKQYPTSGVEASVRAPITSSQSGTNVDLGNTLDQVTNQRSSDSPASDVYYYGLIDPASSFNNYCNGGCTTGVGWVTDLSNWAVSHRAAVGIGFGTRGAGTFTHELGHNHGRNHAPCGGAGGPDSSYPHQNAAIGVWGYDPDEDELLEPSEYRDFMSYCSPAWVSDYTFRALADRIAGVNGVANQQANVLSTAPLETWHRMLITPSGTRWSTPMSGPGAPGSNAEQGTVLDVNGRVIALVDAYRVEISDGGGFMLYVPAPQAGWHAVGPSGGPYLAY